MGTRVTTSSRDTLSNSSMRATGLLRIDAQEAALLLHALKKYVHIKGHELSSSTTRLTRKLEYYLFPNFQE